MATADGKTTLTEVVLTLSVDEAQILQTILGQFIVGDATETIYDAIAAVFEANALYGNRWSIESGGEPHWQSLSMRKR